jgi:hypothetical protein
LDLNDIELTKGSFVDQELQETFTDMLYKTNLNQKEAYLYFLFEHKSRIHQTITLQLLKYMLNIWELVAKQNPGELPVIIPLLIYHGRQKWNVGLKLTDLLPQIPSQVKKYVPDYEYILYDLSTYTEKDIRGEIKQRLFLEMLAGIFQEDFAERIKKILELANELEKKNRSNRLYRDRDALHDGGQGRLDTGKNNRRRQRTVNRKECFDNDHSGAIKTRRHGTGHGKGYGARYGTRYGKGSNRRKAENGKKAVDEGYDCR